MALSMEMGLGPGHIVPDGDAAPLPKKGQSHLQFSAPFYCGQTAECIKIPLGVEVGLVRGHIVLDGDQAPSKRRGAYSPIFGPYLLWQNGRMNQNATWYRVGLSPGDIVLDGYPVRPPLQRGTAPCQIFDPCLLGLNGCMHQDTTWYAGI